MRNWNEIEGSDILLNLGESQKENIGLWLG